MLDFGGVHLPVLVNTLLRSVVVYLAVVVALRVAGKRHVGQLSIVDFVLILLVSNAVQNAMVGPDTSLAGGIVAALTLIVLNWILTRAALGSSRLASAIEGEPTLLVRNGQVLDQHLHREGIRPAELEAAIREHGFDDVRQCRSVIEEADGSISVVPFSGGGGDKDKDPHAANEHRLPPLPSHHHRRRGGRRGFRPGQ
jgi:uncharacterized membrane protein YcaP (DUF421 family)